jgi:hypothetical protein
MQVSLVPPDHIDICWDEISSHLGKSIGTAHGRYTMDDILKEAKSFEQHLWVVFDDTKISLNNKVYVISTQKNVGWPILGWGQNYALER